MRSTARIVSIFLVACLALGQLACTVTVTDANARTGTRGTTTGQQNQDGTTGTGGDPCDFMTAAERQQIADAVALQRDNGVTQQEMLDGFPETACAQAAQQGSAVSTADCVDCMESIVNDVYAGP